MRLPESFRPAPVCGGPASVEHPGLRIGLREPAGERTVVLPRGSVFTVPRGIEHKPYAPARAAILVIEPTGTLSVGDRHDEVPDHVDATTGHALS